jgi:hypothetical protein
MTIHERIGTHEHNGDDAPADQRHQERGSPLEQSLVIVWVLLTAVAMLGWIAALGWAAVRLSEWAVF